ncbi:hypothetical protein ACOKFD_04985 [Flagellimonas sp. S174]|uniref:hypothetical protein n=1 Tax=Flagellimonas sp. S174 TaxID=3410790 RepID=UPI003BF4CCDF
MSQAKFQIDNFSIGESFSKYPSKNLITIDSVSCFKHGVGYRYNKIVSEEFLQDYSFGGYNVSKLAFKVKDDRIEDILCFVEFENIKKFLTAQENQYGLPTSMASRLKGSERRKEKLESIPEKVDLNFILSKISEYKSLCWHNIKTNMNDRRETSLFLEYFPIGAKQDNYSVARMEYIVHKD